MDDSQVKQKPGTDKPATPNFQQMYKSGGTFKQRLEEIVGSFSGGHGGGVEREPHSRESSPSKPVETVQEIPTTPEVEKRPELAGYIEKVENEAATLKPVVDDYTQQVLLKSVNPAKSKVKLPLSQAQIQTGLHHKVVESIRWLAEWCTRQVKLLGARAEYKAEEAQSV